ncbi:hypothetical protein G9F72_018185 [Clostridium estertheticum]|uniref:hypothetical protein n=1 Tax=Clostridium estertheticum TaxID=238834 RepID=UPI0013E94F27|nr:hypothetical protein [Clostridium estertheticum]MBZ9688264.1 hypothetical protein [Clostridium estertheticum]
MKQYLAIACKLITDASWDTEWEVHSQMFGVDEYVRRGRLLRSQTFRDPDYSACVLETFNKIFDKVGEEKTKAFVGYVLNNALKSAGEEFTTKNAYFISLMNSDNSNSTILEGIQISFNKFINLVDVPDGFYRDLHDEINRAYNFGIYSVIPFLLRKFMENLMIDILRKKYTAQSIEIYYDVNNHKCHSFSQIVSNFENKLEDFKNIEKNLDTAFIKRVNSYRDSGNSTAHSISIKFGTLEISKLKESSEEVEYIIKLLIRVLNLI